MIERSRKAHQSTERAMRPRQTFLKRFIENVRGAIFIPMVIFFLFLMGIAGLILDVGRIYTMNTTAQAYVDQIALAAAQELDGQPGAVQRARLAAFGGTIDSATHKENVLKKLYPFAQDDDLVNLSELIFFKELPDDTGYQYNIQDILTHSPEGGGSNITTADADAAFVIAISRATGVWTSLLRIVRWGGGADAAPDVFATASVAVATLITTMCDQPLLMMCDPFENVDGYTWEEDLDPGDMIHLKKKGGSDSSWGPGIFSTIDLDLPPARDYCPQTGANATPRQTCQLGVYFKPESCIPGNTIDLDPGQSIPVNEGINLRFNIYSQRTQDYWLEMGDADGDGENDDPLFPPDGIVTKGLSNGVAPGELNSPGQSGGSSGQGGGKAPKDCKMTGKGATEWEEAASIRMPRDACIDAGNCSPSSRIGDGGTDGQAALQTALDNYFERNYGLAARPSGVDTRYAAYLWEWNTFYGNNENLENADLYHGLLESKPLAEDYEFDPPPDPVPPAEEFAVPACMKWDDSDYNGDDLTPGEFGRRILMVAVAKCGGLDNSDGIVGGNAANVGVVGLVETLLTEPAVNNDLSPSNDDIYVEVIKVHPKAKSAKFHQYPHLVR